jgi:hypothetical protein
VTRIRQLLRGGSAANEHLTAVVAALLLLLLAVEGATLLHIRSLLTVHAFVAMLLIPIVVLKLASTGWRMLRALATVTVPAADRLQDRATAQVGLDDR